MSHTIQYRGRNAVYKENMEVSFEHPLYVESWSPPIINTPLRSSTVYDLVKRTGIQHL